MIGPNIVLTAGHVLCQKLLNEKREKTIFNAIEVSFGPACTENFNPLNNFVCTEKYYINDKYIDLLREREQIEFDIVDEKYKNDWALIFLPYNVGDHIRKLFDVDLEAQEKLTVKNGIYKFFNDSISDIEELKLNLEEGSNEISMIAYTEKDIDLNQVINSEDTGELSSQNDSAININFAEKPKQLNKNAVDSTINMIGENNFSIPYAESNIKLQPEIKKIVNDQKQKQINNQIVLKKPSKKNDFVIYKTILDNNIKEKFKGKIGQKNKEKSENSCLSMCESKGFLYNPKNEINENFLYYQFNTLKGQSGAPVFLRVKNMNSNNNNQIVNNYDSTSNNYNYYFIGLHIRRGPNKITPFTVLTDFQFDVESKVLAVNNKTKINPTTQTQNSLDYSNFQPKSLDIDDTKPKTLNTNITNNNFTKQQVKNEQILNLKKEHGECEYNISLKLTKSIIAQIFSSIKSSTDSVTNKFLYTAIDNTVQSSYVMLNLFHSNNIKLKGLFNRGTELLTVFQLAGKIMNVKKKYTCLELRSSDDIKYRTYDKQIFEYDKNKKLNDLVLDNMSSNSGSFSFNNSEYCINFDIGLNISLYSDFLTERILNKVSQNQNIELLSLKQSPLKYSKFLNVAIFVEIKDFNNIYTTYGDLFQSLKNKLGIK